MTLKLTGAEKILLLDSIETRQIKILGLIKDFKENKLMTVDTRDYFIKGYQKDYEMLSDLLIKLRKKIK